MLLSVPVALRVLLITSCAYCTTNTGKSQSMSMRKSTVNAAFSAEIPHFVERVCVYSAGKEKRPCGLLLRVVAMLRTVRPAAGLSISPPYPAHISPHITMRHKLQLLRGVSTARFITLRITDTPCPAVSPARQAAQLAKKY